MTATLLTRAGRAASNGIVLSTTFALAACGGGAPRPEAAAPESDADLDTRARLIHERVIALDTHNDIPADFATTEVDPGVRGDRQVDLPKMLEGGLDVSFLVVYVPQGELTSEGYAQAREQAMQKFAGIHRLAEEMYPERIGLATSADEVERLVAEGKLVAAIGIENGYPMGEDLSAIAEFKELGASYMSITHNRHNQLGDSQTPADDPLHGGLSELGRQAVAELNRVGIMIDVSHAGKATMMQVAGLSQAPVIASHSAVAALRAHGRNLDDEQLLALQKNGGVIQIVALGEFVKELPERRAAIIALRDELGLGRPGRGAGSGQPPELSAEERKAARAEFRRRMPEIDARFPNATVGDVVDHIDYAVKLIGIDHVAISSDFDGGGGVEGWNDAAETFNVTRELVERGYNEAEIDNLWSGNTLRVWREVEELAKRLQAEAGS